MNPTEILLARGAKCVGGDIIFRGTLMGRLRNGVFISTPEGDAELEVEEAQVKPVKLDKAKPAKAKPAEAADTTDVDQLLG